MSAHTRGRRPAPVRVVQPKRLPAEIPWDPAYHYECSRGHRVASDMPCCSCPCCPGGESCDGELCRVGPHGGRVRS